MSTNKSADFIDTMGEWFDKFPAIPKNGREVLVKIAPIISLVFGILGILIGISGLGILTIFSPVAFLGGATGYGAGFLSALIYLVSSVVLLISYPGLKAHKYKGWKLLFWSQAIDLVGGLVSMAIISAIIGALIGFYLIYQIRSYYK
jgi:hypothetical protein